MNRKQVLEQLCRSVGDDVKQILKEEGQPEIRYALVLVESGPRGGVSGRVASIDSNIPAAQYLQILRNLVDHVELESEAR